MKEIFNKIKVKLKHFGKEVLAFLSSTIFLKNFAGVLGMLLVLFFFTTTWLKCYTDHGEGVHLANFEGMGLNDVKDYAKSQGFDIVVDSVDIDRPALEVIEQHPKPDALVKEGRTVYLRVQQVKKDDAMIPQLTGNNEDAEKYRAELRRAGFIVTSRTKVDSRVASNTVLEILLNEKDITDLVRDGAHPKITRGSKLTLIISEKGYGNVKVPELICKPLAQAKLILEGNNLNVGTIEYDASVTDKNTAYVWLQDPLEGSSIRFGEQVKLRVTQYLPDDCEENELEAPLEDSDSDNEEDDSENEGF
ncbi:MAG: PASTA domain-containing protein [Bacteroidota bacterium]